MPLLRSLAFNLFFFAWTACLCVLGLPLLLAPRPAVVRMSHVWSCGIALALQALVGARHEVRGRENAQGQAIYAFKHQSAWETVLLPLLVGDPITVLKRELMRIPVFGWYLVRTSQIPVDRGGGAKALKSLLRAAAARVAAGHSIVIFPEGTRVKPGEHRPYQPGVAALYDRLRLPVVPVALNSGLVLWPRRGFFKRPGRIVVEFLPPIAPGLPRREFIATLERATETACRRLLEGANLVK